MHFNDSYRDKSFLKKCGLFGQKEENDYAHKHLVAENCVSAQFCVNDYTKLRPVLILALILCNNDTKLSIDTIFSHQMFMCF